MISMVSLISATFFVRRKRLPICGVHILEYELAIEEIYLSMCARHVLIVPCKVIIIPPSERKCRFLTQIDKQLFFHVHTDLYAFETDLF